MNIETTPIRTLRALLSIIAVLVLVNLVGVGVNIATVGNNVPGVIALFDLNAERNIPTLFSSMQLAFAGLLLFVIARKHQMQNEQYIAWMTLAAIFMFLAVDETAVIHERLGDPMRAIVNPGGLFYFPWVIPYGIAVLLLFASFSRFLLRLPKPIGTWFVASGAIYVGGALGSEMLSARHKELNGAENLTYALYYTFEETLEMVGIALFIYALLRYACMMFEHITVEVQE